MMVAHVVLLVRLSHQGECGVVLQKSGFRNIFFPDISSLLSQDEVSPFPTVFEVLNFTFIWASW